MSRIKHLLLICLLWAPFFTIEAQQLVETDSFKALEGNIFARRNPREDVSGNPCAVVFVRSTIPDLHFYGNVMGDVAYENATYVVYVQAGTEQLEIYGDSKNKLILKFSPLQSKATYEVTVQETSDKGTIELITVPSGADVYMIAKGERIHLGRTPLKGNALIKTGKYQVEIEKQGYRSARINNVKIVKDKTTKLGKVKLKP